MFDYMKKLITPDPYTYCGAYRDSNLLGSPIRCNNRIKVGERECAECQVRQARESVGGGLSAVPSDGQTIVSEG